jgi:hypothetical protein
LVFACTSGQIKTETTTETRKTLITFATKSVQPDGQTVDVTTWAPHDDYPVFPVGSKPKRMLVCPADVEESFLAQGHSYLFKTAVGWQRQQVWSEVIAYKVGAELGLPVAWRMIQRRAAELGTRARIGCHTFRATGITAYLEAGGTLENAQAMAAHESPRTTKLYDRTGDEITLDEVERITI